MPSSFTCNIIVRSEQNGMHALCNHFIILFIYLFHYFPSPVNTYWLAHSLSTRVLLCIFTPTTAVYSYLAGDSVCQALETFDTDTEFAWDHARTMRMGITGAFVTTPASFTWNLYAERIAPGTSIRAVMTKLAVSIAVFPPMVRYKKTRGPRGLFIYFCFFIHVRNKLPVLYIR